MCISVNKNAMKLVRQMIEEKNQLAIAVSQLHCGTTLVDCGVLAFGSYEAGLLYTKASMGGVGSVQLNTWPASETVSFASVDVFITDTLNGILHSQMSGWSLGTDAFAPIASGPGRAKAAVPEDIYMGLSPYRDSHNEAVLCLQMLTLPDEALALTIAHACKVEPQNLYLLIASNACLTGSIQIAARSVEQMYHKLSLIISPDKIKNARGNAPIAPIGIHQKQAMGRINDALIYGAHSEFWLEASDEFIKKNIHQLVAATASPYYPEPFKDTFEKAGENFFNMDFDGDSGASIQINSLLTGNGFSSGKIRRDLILKSFMS